MNPAKWQEIKNLMGSVLDAPIDQRADFLARAGDAEIRREVEKLLAAHEKAGTFIDEPILSGGDSPAKCFEENLAGTKIDDYLILEKLGAGGMGAVYLAEHRGEDFAQRVALKLIKRGMDSDAVLKRFLMERQILASLDHPNIARLLDAGTTRDGSPYFVMEHVEGESVKKFCQRRNLGTREILELFAKVCRAVSYAHQKLVIHRDIKPSNIIVTEAGEPKLLDFGIAKLFSGDWNATATEATLINLRMMTPEYASPEQLRGQITTTATDVYSLGVVLYELLTGARPFEFKSQSIFEISEKIAATEPARPSSVVSFRFQASSSNSAHQTDENKGQRTKNEGQNTNPKSSIPNPKSLRGDLDNIILKAIRREAPERYRSVEEFCEDIGFYLRGLPVRATKDSTRYRLWKFAGRHRRALSLAACVSLLVLTLSGLSIFQGVTARRERDKANERFEKLRDVARLLMTETRESLVKVPGTMQIQKSLAEKSVELLDGIYDETTTDTQFLSELAGSYEKLCRTQYWQFRELEKAETSCGRAVELRRRVAGLEPDDVQRKAELIGSLGSYSELAQMRGNYALTLEKITEIENVQREIAARQPNEKNLSDLAVTLLGGAQAFEQWKASADTEKRRQEGGAILQSVIETLENRQLSPADQTDLAWKMMWQGENFRKLGDDARALQMFERAALIAEKAYRADRSLQYAFNHTSRAHREMGEIYEKQGLYEKALEMYKFSFDWLQTRAGDSSMNRTTYIFGVHFYANRCALMLVRLGRVKEADALIATPFSEYAAFLDREEDAGNILFGREPFADLARYYVETARLEKAVEIWRQYDAQLQKFLATHPNDLGFLFYRAEAAARIGDIYADYDETRDSFKTSDAPRLKKAAGSYENAAALLRTLQPLYAPTRGEKAALEKIERKLEKLSPRRAD